MNHNNISEYFYTSPTESQWVDYTLLDSTEYNYSHISNEQLEGDVDHFLLEDPTLSPHSISPGSTVSGGSVPSPLSGSDEETTSYEDLALPNTIDTTTERRQSTKRNGRSKLPEPAVIAMGNWFKKHKDSPYPQEDDKLNFKRTFNITTKQINQWFISKRRQWKERLAKVNLLQAKIQSEMAQLEQLKRNKPKETTPAYTTNTTQKYTAPQLRFHYNHLPSLVTAPLPPAPPLTTIATTTNASSTNTAYDYDNLSSIESRTLSPSVHIPTSPSSQNISIVQQLPKQYTFINHTQLSLKERELRPKHRRTKFSHSNGLAGTRKEKRRSRAKNTRKNIESLLEVSPLSAFQNSFQKQILEFENARKHLCVMAETLKLKLSEHTNNDSTVNYMATDSTNYGYGCYSSPLMAAPPQQHSSDNSPSESESSASVSISTNFRPPLVFCSLQNGTVPPLWSQYPMIAQNPSSSSSFFVNNIASDTYIEG